MREYTGEDQGQLVEGAHACRYFMTAGTGRNRGYSLNGITCRDCRNWNSTGCGKNAYDREMEGMDME